MKAEEKAKELLDQFADGLCEKLEMYNSEIKLGAKQCALICVEEILNLQYVLNGLSVSIIDYWNEVKQEINKL
tara:strand:+ start:10868 stop:11086 length:219 start_codon:yes stop_codon:yes gene_type:complete